MVTVELCECGHFPDDHILEECHNCGWEYDKYGELQEKKGGTTCKGFTKQYEAELMICDKVEFGKGYHGILTLYIHLKNGCSHQVYGGYCLDDFNKKKDKRVGSAFGTGVIVELLNWVGKENLDEIKGMYFWALRDGSRGKIEGLKRLEVETTYKDNDHVFSFEKLVKEYGVGG